MQQNDVKIGKAYAAKVNDRVSPVRIDSENEHGGWNGTNLRTNKQVRIKSAQRLRNEITVPEDADKHDYPGKLATDEANKAKGPNGGRRKKKTTKKQRQHQRAQAKADQANTAKRDEREAAPDGMTESERAMAESEGQRKKTSVTKAERQDGKKMGCLDAAAEVLKDADEPMNTKQMVEAMAERGLWASDAPTPWATLYSALLREIKNKGDEARFEKADRGKFQIRKGG